MNAFLHIMKQLVPVPARALALFLRRWLVCTLMLAVAIVLAIIFSLVGTWLGASVEDPLLASMFQFAGAAVVITGGSVYLAGTGVAAWLALRAELCKAPTQI